MFEEPPTLHALRPSSQDARAPVHGSFDQPKTESEGKHGREAPMGVDEGLRVVADVARVKVGGDDAHEQLQHVQDELALDLRWLSVALAEACEHGVSPAREAAAHLVSSGGKRVRPVATLLAASCCQPLVGALAERVRTVAVAAELVHSATLLHDDVIDDGDERRGRPTSRKVYGNAVSVLAGDLLLTTALGEIHALGEDRVLADLIGTLRQLVDGEIVQLRGRVHLDLTEATYDRIVLGKTASLFAWACRSGARIAGAEEPIAAALGTFGAHLGVAFQLVDDLIDLTGDPHQTGKALFVDLREGKPTLPLLRALARRPGLAGQVRALREGDEGLALEVAKTIAECGAIDDVRKRARSESERALSALALVRDGAAREAQIQVARDLAERVS